MPIAYWTGLLGMLPIFAKQPGFVRYGALVAGKSILSLSIWETEAEAEAANRLAADWVRDNLATRVRLEATHTGDLAFFQGPAQA